MALRGETTSSRFAYNRQLCLGFLKLKPDPTELMRSLEHKFSEFKKRSRVLARLKGLGEVCCEASMILCHIASVLKRVGGRQEWQHVVVGSLPIDQDFLELYSLTVAELLKAMNDRQRGFLIYQISPQRFANFLRSTDDIEHVINDLECNPQVSSIRFKTTGKVNVRI